MVKPMENCLICEKTIEHCMAHYCVLDRENYGKECTEPVCSTDCLNALIDGIDDEWVN